ncbi:hypothetical protein D9M68_696730 [compost metagenome]
MQTARLRCQCAWAPGSAVGAPVVVVVGLVMVGNAHCGTTRAGWRLPIGGGTHRGAGRAQAVSLPLVRWTRFV